MNDSLSLDEGLSRKMSRWLRGLPSPSGWNLAAAALVRMTQMRGATYVEGLVVVRPGLQPVEHAWLERNGRVVDVRYLDAQPPPAYFLALRLSRLELKKWFADRAPLPITTLCLSGDSHCRERIPVWRGHRLFPRSGQN